MKNLGSAFLLTGASAQEIQTTSPLSAEVHRVQEKPDVFSSASLLETVGDTIEIGIIELPNRESNKLAIRETIERLRRAFAPHKVNARVLPSKVLEKRIIDGSIDAFIASSGYYLRMAKHGAISVGSFISDEAPDPNNGIAGVYLVARDNLDIAHLKDLKGRRLYSSFSTAFMGFRTGLAEIAAMGYDPDHFFSEIKFLGKSLNKEIVERMLRGQADAALITACWLEDMPEEFRAQVRVINPKTGNINCLHSTRTYPSITMAVTQGAAPGIAHIISRTLMTMKPLSNNFRWGIATDFRSVDRVYRELKIENYAYLREPIITVWIRTHWYVLAFLLFAVLGLIRHSWRVGVLVRKRTAELVKTAEEKRIAQMKADALREREQNLQKTMLVGQLSSMIAHELSQPLAAIRYYCEGQKALLSEPGEVNKPMLEKARQGISDALTNVVAIVDKVRSYNRGKAKRNSSVELQKCIHTAVQSLNSVLLSRTHISIVGLHDVYIVADPLEAEILFHNLLKNAIEAANEAADTTHERARIRVCAQRDQGRIIVKIENNGLEIDDQAFLRLTTPLITTKATGNGLGIPIAMALAEASGGHIAFERRPQGGIIAIVTLNEAPGEDTDE